MSSQIDTMISCTYCTLRYPATEAECPVCGLKPGYEFRTVKRCVCCTLFNAPDATTCNVCGEATFEHTSDVLVPIATAATTEPSGTERWERAVPTPVPEEDVEDA